MPTESTKALDETARSFCGNPEPAGFESLRAGFQRSMDAWQAVRYIRFGPVELFLRHHRFQIWPDRRNSVGKQLGRLIDKADPKVDDPKKFAQASVAVQGLSALERLLYGEAASSEAFKDNYRPANMHELARIVQQLWQKKAETHTLDLYLGPVETGPRSADTSKK